MNSVLEFLSLNRVKNFDIMIEKNPLSYNVKIYKYYSFDESSGGVGDNLDLFGYSDKMLNKVIKSKAIIDFNPSKSFLNSVGLFYESSLPIIGYFKSVDKVMKQDIIEVEYINFISNDIIGNKFVVVDIITISFIVPYIYRLSPIRG